MATVTVYSPLSTDIVECLHGFCQSLIQSGGRGTRPTDEGAAERLMWAFVTRSYQKLRNLIWNNFADSQAAHRFKRFGRKGCNQYSAGKEAGDKQQHSHNARRPGLTMEKMDRAIALGQQLPNCRPPRKLCGDLDALLTAFS